MPLLGKAWSFKKEMHKLLDNLTSFVLEGYKKELNLKKKKGTKHYTQVIKPKSYT